MSDKAFLDTNILVYAHTDFDSVKQLVAQKLISNTDSSISTQVVQELANTLSRKFKHSWKAISNVLADATSNNSVHVNGEDTIRQACQIADRYGYSFYDSLVVAAAIESSSTILYSEDLQDGQIIEGKLTIKNPFK